MRYKLTDRDNESVHFTADNETHARSEAVGIILELEDTPLTIAQAAKLLDKNVYKLEPVK